MKEGNYKFYEEVLYNHTVNSVVSSKSGYHIVPDNCLDMVSVFFYIRRLDFSNMKIGTEIKVTTYFSDEIYPFSIRYMGTEKVNARLGKFDCLKFVPIVEPGRIFESEDDMTIWLTNDQNRVPLQIKFDMLVGSFKLDLVEYSNTMTPLQTVK